MGSPITHSFNIRNNGTGTLLISNPTGFVSGPGYSLLTAPSSTIAANGSASFTVAFSPPGSSPDPFLGSVAITSNSMPSPYSFGLTSTVSNSPPSFQVSYTGPDGATDSGIGTNSAFTFPSTQAGMESIAEITIRNESTDSTLTVVNPTVTGGSGFSLAGGGWSGTLSAGESQNELIEFQNATAGTYSATFSVTIGGTVFNVDFTITETPAAPAITAVWDGTTTTIGPCSFSYFPNTPYGTPVSQVLDIGNAGEAPLVISSVTVASNSDCFSLIASPSSSIAPGTTSQGRIRLYSTVNIGGGTECFGYVSINSNDPNYPSFAFFIDGIIGPTGTISLASGPPNPASCADTEHGEGG